MLAASLRSVRSPLLHSFVCKRDKRHSMIKPFDRLRRKPAPRTVSPVVLSRRDWLQVVAALHSSANSDMRDSNPVIREFGRKTEKITSLIERQIGVRHHGTVIDLSPVGDSA